MAILREYNWQRVVRTAKGIFGRVPLAIGVDIGSRLMKIAVIQADHNVKLHRRDAVANAVITYYRDIYRAEKKALEKVKQAISQKRY